MTRPKLIHLPPPAGGLHARQSGVALFISLVLLLVLTIIGVSAVQTTSLEVRMARNDYDSLLAFEAAESALRDAEELAEAILTTDDFSDVGTNGLWTIAEHGEVNRWESADIWTGTRSIVAANAVAGVAAPARYIIEFATSVQREEAAHLLGGIDISSEPDQIDMFRITARGVGGTAQASVTLQSIYGRIL